MHAETAWPSCWCGSGTALTAFNDEYLLCDACETLVCIAEPDESTAGVREDERDFYGAQYWLRHQSERFGLPTLSERARADLSERCIFWLRSLLSARTPPGRLLEIGAAHGAFVKLASLAGFDAVGIEMSPAIIEYAQRTFGVRMLRGPLEATGLPVGSFDVICSFDVLEHFRDPLATLSQMRGLLTPDGIALIQTPRYPAEPAEPLRLRNDRFLLHLRSPEHIYLLSARSFEEMVHRAGFASVQFLPPMFDYDQFAVLSSKPVILRDDAELAEPLITHPEGRVALALLDAARDSAELRSVAAERLTIIERLKTARDEGLKEIDGLTAACDERLDLINRLEAQLKAHLEVIDGLKAACDERLDLINRLDAELKAQRQTPPGN